MSNIVRVTPNVKDVKIVTNTGPNSVKVTKRETRTVVVSSPGPRGPQGPQGPAGALGSDANYIHQQVIPNSLWSVTHNLNKKPSVTVVDSSGSVIDGDVLYLDENTVIINFSAAFGGEAYFN